MKKSSVSIFMLISTLMLLLHILRGSDLTFIISGWIPYVLYYSTITLYVVGLLYRIYDVLKKKGNR